MNAQIFVRKLQVIGGMGIIAFLLGSCQNFSIKREAKEETVVGSVNQNSAEVENTADSADTALKPAIRFVEDMYDFGKIKEGVKVEHEFTFVNEGKSPLILRQVTASCGCTTPEYSQKPIAPGEKGVVKVAFDSNGQVGRQHKVITVVSNAGTPITLVHLRGEVLSK